ncbi:uncharacterized protein LOC128723810 [Anopheles nili]|uniref:uncharacterized protein LOC128723810 n=1 Tax=Anopheles nili TaxID=185578 RepID=UPI00237A3DA0|nr:uncharacterized protein LOC128723810 [Anopheles nili]
MYNQVFGGSIHGYPTDYQLQCYYHQQPQQTQLLQKQQMAVGIASYFPTEAMLYNTYSYAHGQLAQQQVQQFAQSPYHPLHHQPTEFQLTPALYLLKQQAELLQKSLSKGRSKKPHSSGVNVKSQRKPRGPYKRRQDKTLSPTVSPAPELDTDTELLSSSDLSSSNNRSMSSIHTEAQQQIRQKRKSDSYLVNEQSQSKMLRRKESIFRDVALMAVSSCSQACV